MGVTFFLTAPRIRRLRDVAEDVDNDLHDSSAYTEIKAGDAGSASCTPGQLRVYGD